MGKTSKIAVISLSCMLMILLSGVGVRAAEEDLTASTYISDISVVSVSDGLTDISDGIKVLPDRIGSSLIGYTTPDSKSNALKNIILSASGSAPVTKDGASYEQLCSIAGKTLYGTRDGSAGEGIVALTLIDRPLIGDGTHTVRNESGEAVELDGLYLATVSAGQTGAYISELALVKGGSENGAIKKAADQGFDYYKLISDEDGKVVLIAFNRTNDKDKAVRAIFAVGEQDDYKLFYSLSEDAGLPITDVELKEVTEFFWDDATFELGDWAQTNFGSGIYSGSVSYILQDDDYKDLAEDSTTYRWDGIPRFEDKAALAEAIMGGDLTGTDEIDVVAAHEDSDFTPGGDIMLEGVDMEKFLAGAPDEEETEDEDAEDAEEVPDEATEDTVVDDTNTEDTDGGVTDDQENGDIALDEPGADLPDKSADADGSSDGAEAGSDTDSIEVDAGAVEDTQTTGSLISSGNYVVITICIVSAIGLILFGVISSKKKGEGL